MFGSFCSCDNVRWVMFFNNSSERFLENGHFGRFCSWKGRAGRRCQKNGWSYANLDSTLIFVSRNILLKIPKKNARQNDMHAECHTLRIPCVWHSCSDSSCMGFVWHSCMCMAFSWHFVHPKFVEMNFVLGAFFSMLQINLGIFPPSF